jgi:hypothetical protein
MKEWEKLNEIMEIAKYSKLEHSRPMEKGPRHHLEVVPFFGSTGV